MEYIAYKSYPISVKLKGMVECKKQTDDIASVSSKKDVSRVLSKYVVIFPNEKSTKIKVRLFQYFVR